MSCERDERDWFLKMARWDLKSAREQKDDLDVSGYVEDIRSWAKSADVSLADLGTSEEELRQLVQTGYESEARICLELARGMYGYSRIHLYLRAVRNIGQCFRKEPNFHRFRSFLVTVFCLRPCHTRQYYIAQTREYLTKANIFPSDIGTDEAELVQLGS
jgi:hypothetical protein